MPGLLDAMRQYMNDASPGGALNPEVPPGMARGLLGFTPGVGDAMSGYDAIQSARQGNYGEAGLNALGLLPFMPGLGGIVKPGMMENVARLKKQLGTTREEWEPSVVAAIRELEANPELRSNPKMLEHLDALKFILKEGK